MNYPLPDGTILQSNSNSPVVYICDKPSNWSDGTFISYETTSDENNNLVQIKIVRIISNDQVQITITEQTQQEIEDYFQNIIN